MNPYIIDTADLKVIRRLAAAVAEAAASPRNQECLQQWYAHDCSAAARPLILTEHDGGPQLVDPGWRLECKEEWAQTLEQQLKEKLLHFTVIKDDEAVLPAVNVGWAFTAGSYGVDIVQNFAGDGRDGRGAFHYDPPLKNLERDFERLHFREYSIDREASAALFTAAQEICGSAVTVRRRHNFSWSYGMTNTAISLIGLEEMMLAMYDAPETLHRLLDFLCCDYQRLLDYAEKEELLTLNNEDDYIGSGSRGFTRALPAPGFTGRVRTADLWGLFESQETAGVGPEQFAEFILPYQKRSELSFMETVHMFVDMFENNEHKLSGSRKVTSHFEKLSDAHYMRSSNNISHILKVDYVRGVIKYLQLGDDGRYYKQQNSIENFIVESYAKMQILANSYETAFMAGLKLYTKSYEKDRKYWVENYSKTAFFRSTKKDTKTNQTPTLAELLSLADEYTRHLIKCTFKLSTFKNTNHIGWVSSFRKMFHLMISEKWGKVKTTLTILDIFGIPHDQTFATHDYICIFPGEERNIPEPYVYGHGLWTAEIKGHEYINKLPKIFRMMAHETEWAIPEFQSVMDDIFEEYGRQIEQELYEAFDRNKRISKQKSLIRAETRKKENEINKEYSSTATCFQLLKKIKEQTDNKLAISLARATLLVALRDKGIFSIVTRDFQTLNTTPTTEQITKALKQSFGLALTKYSVSEIVFAIPSKEHCPYSNPYIPKNDNGVTANIAFDVDTPDGQRIKMNKMSKLIANAYSCNTYTPYIKSLEKIVLYYAEKCRHVILPCAM